MSALTEFVSKLSWCLARSISHPFVAAKTLFIAREQNEPVTLTEIKTLAAEVGWKLPEAKITQVAKDAERLKFVVVD